MKTLYEKIDKEVLTEMEKDRKDFLILVEIIESDLKNNYYIDDLKWLTVRYIYIYKYGSYFNFDVLNFLNLFN